ncbi:MAG: trypsin-like peptidase domain-containing protein, partial [bacterium]|nr:trypsin-like peptidase domain-containing protein [bacterium]
TVVTPVSTGSGVVVREGDYILTNYHVVEDCNLFSVLLPSGEEIDATLVGSDSSLDIAVLHTESEELVPCEIGTVADMLVGSTVVAIGNPGGSTLANTVTQGIVSCLERSVDGGAQRSVNYIQHDAPISSGNSGGGLFDYRGRLVGINTLKYASSALSKASYEGLGFALPVDTVIPLVDQIIEHGKVIRPQMGVYTLDWEGPDHALDTYPPASVLIADLVEEGPAERAGMKLYDFITSVDGISVANYREMTQYLDQCEAGQTVKVTVLRYENIEEFLSYYYGGSTGAPTSLFGFYSAPTLYGYDTVELEITLEILD